MFADIAYGTGSGYKSIQGLVICFGGSPIAWQSSSQPFVTHSTAEAELVSYCGALTAGRATEALISTMWGEPLTEKNTLETVIYGDNAAAISLAYGNSNTSWCMAPEASAGAIEHPQGGLGQQQQQTNKQTNKQTTTTATTTTTIPEDHGSCTTSRGQNLLLTA